MAAETSSLPIQFLVTDDHAYFKAFVQSEVAETVLRNEVKAILGIRKAVHVGWPVR